MYRMRLANALRQGLALECLSLIKCYFQQVEIECGGQQLSITVSPIRAIIIHQFQNQGTIINVHLYSVPVRSKTP